MAKFLTTKRAERDIQNIALFGMERFGATQAHLYQQGLEIKLKMLAANPKLGQSVDFIRADYRRSTYESHSIYYRIRSDDILIVRVLGRQKITQEALDHDS